MLRRPPSSPLFPYTPLFRSRRRPVLARAGPRGDAGAAVWPPGGARPDRESTRLDSRHTDIYLMTFFFFKCSAAHRALPSSPTRRSSDLADVRYSHEPAHEETPERLFDRRWALD